MDLSFHYFAVKSVARAAGYKEQQAQRIAEFSQFIDDYNWYAYFRAGNIPDYIKEEKYDFVYNELLGIVNPVTTGFYDWVDMATLILPRSQKYTVAPFHFIPQDIQSVQSEDYRTVPATGKDGSYISDSLEELKTEIADGTLKESDALMKMGMLLHTFADTYAHQLFSGYAQKVNSVKLTRVTNNITGEDETEQYHFFVEQWIANIEKVIKMKLPTIGHMAIAHIPDLTHLSFEMEYEGADGQKHSYGRSNVSTFVTACKEIYYYMREVLGSRQPADMEWDALAEKLADGFLTDISKEAEQGEKAAVAKLTQHWASVFARQGYSYSYDSSQIKERFILSHEGNLRTVRVQEQEMQLWSKDYSDEFYKYNLFADMHLIRLYGDHPRNWLSEEEMICE